MSVRARLLVVLWLTGAVSIACNVLAVGVNVEADSAGASVSVLVARGVAAWPPIALLLVVEVLARVELPGRLRWIALGGAGAVALPAAVASFHHMHTVAVAAGESPLVAWLFPLTVDGLAVVTTVALAGLHRADEATAGSGLETSNLSTEGGPVVAPPLDLSPALPEPSPVPVVADVRPGAAPVVSRGPGSARRKRPPVRRANPAPVASTNGVTP